MSELSEFIIPIRRCIHQNPELGFETFKTAGYVKAILDELGYQTELVVGGAGVLGFLDLKKSKTIAFRSDLDGLPIKEETGLPFASQNGLMHACGHDGHISMLLGAAKLLKENQDKLKTNIILIFQPAEEAPLPGGAIRIIETHKLDKVSMFFAFHVTNRLRVGQAAIKLHEACAAPDHFKIIVRGQSCHASSPQNGLNPLLPASRIVLALAELNNEIQKEDPYTVITTTTFKAGDSYNIIPEQTVLAGTARSFTAARREEIRTRMENAIKTIAESNKTKADFIYENGYDPVYNNDLPFAIAHSAEAEELGEDKALILKEPSMIGEDFAYYRRLAPIAFSWLGVRGPQQDFFDLHSSHFILDEEALEKGARIWLRIALDCDEKVFSAN